MFELIATVVIYAAGFYTGTHFPLLPADIKKAVSKWFAAKTGD